jgi:hypothetical protein
MREMYAKEINRAKSSIEEEEKKIVNNKIENKRINQLLSSNSNIKEVLKNIINDKDLSVIKNLFKHVIDKVVIFNADKRDDVVRVRFKNGIESEFIYCARLLGNKYILLEKPLRYDEDLRTIVSEVVPTYIIIDNDEFVFYRRTESNLESEKRLFPTLTIHNTQTYAITNGLTVKEFVKIVRDTNIAIPFERLEEETELAKTQKAHYQQWRKKYNTGKPSGVTYILHNETYEEIQTYLQSEGTSQSRNRRPCHLLLACLCLRHIASQGLLQVRFYQPLR